MLDRQISLEQTLAKLEGDVDVTVKAAKTALTALRKILGAAHVGDLRELRKAREAAEQAIVTLQQQFANVREGWDFDEETYLTGSGFLSELVETAKRAGLKLYEQDGQLYAYPFLIRVIPGERAVTIDRIRERRLRPQILVAHLKELQIRPVRFKPEAFLEALYEAYRVLTAERGGALVSSAQVIPLIRVYDLLTLLPGHAKEYQLQEFARDIYLLDQSGVSKTKRGTTMSLPAATGTKSAKNVLGVITKEGHKKKYYAISFSVPDGA